MPHADLGDVRLYYQQRGEGPPILGIMGFALDQRFWAAQIPPLTKKNSFVTFDNRGIGRSDGEPPTSIEQMADDAVRLLDHLGIDRAIVFGLSMGGAIAQHVALADPERVSALILAVTWARPIEFMRRQDAVAAELVANVGPTALVEASLLRMFTPAFFEVGQETIDRMVAAFYAEGGPEAGDTEVLLGQLGAIGKHDVLARLSEIDCPTLVLGGETDMMVPGFASQEIAEAIPQAELTMFATGHACMIEEMQAFNARLEEFLAKLA